MKNYEMILSHGTVLTVSKKFPSLMLETKTSTTQYMLVIHIDLQNAINKDLHISIPPNNFH